MSKDWKGNDKSVWKILGASSHTEEEREINDYYATEPLAMKLLLKEEEFDNNIWECACVDSETEFFNGEYWKKICEYQEGERVLCYDGEYGKMLIPQKYHKIQTEEKMYLFSGRNINMKVSPEHTIVYLHRRKNTLQKDTAKNVFETYQKDSNGFRGKIPTTFKFNGKLVVNEWYLRLAVACNADGRTRTKYKKTYQIRVKKSRKKERLRWILENAQIPYKYLEYSGYSDFRFESPLGCKIFPKEWINLTDELKNIFIEEIKYWDGSVDGKSIRYFTSKKEDADIVQFIAHTIGKNVVIKEDKRKNKINYILSFKNKTTPSLAKQGSNNVKMEIPFDNFKYCFTVKTGMLILRRNNYIFITGNCGGGHLAEVLKNTGHNVRCSDIIDRGYPQTEIIDFLKVVPDSQNLWNGDIITNPPYSFAQAFVEKAMDLIQDGHKVAMFLKLTFLEGKSRKGMFKKYPPKIIYVSSSRLKCCKNGDFENNFSSAVAYGWFVWEKGFQGDPIIKWIN